jgi:hypothetical protein
MTHGSVTQRQNVQTYTLPIRLMVGLWFLVPAIGVRVPDRQQPSESD